MRIFRLALWLRPAGLGLLFAAIGFSYALATSASRGTGETGTSRATVLGSNCVRPPASFVTSSDLGNVIIGTQFTRQLEVIFGFKPHRFLFGATSPSDGIELTQDGVLKGTKKDATTESFDISVQDNSTNLVPSPVVTKTFTLTGVTQGFSPSVPLQFINDSVLPVALSSEPYTFTVQANGGAPPYSYSFGSSTDFVNFPAGLSLVIETGEIIGKPVNPNGNPKPFTLVVIDHAGTQVKKTFTLKVLPGTITSDFIATSGTFKLALGRTGTGDEGRDSLKLSIVLNKTALANAGIRTKSDLQGVGFQMKFGGAQLPPTVASTDTTTTASKPGIFDKNGKIKFPNLIQNIQRTPGTKVAYEVDLNPVTGVLTATFQNVKLVEGIGAQFEGFSAQPAIPVQVSLQPKDVTATTPAAAVARDTTVTDLFSHTDLIQFSYRRDNANGKGTTHPDHLHAPAGFFLVNSLRGVERQVGPNTDRLFFKITGFLRQTGGIPLNIDKADQVNVILGTSLCIGQFAASSFTQVGDKLILVNLDTNFGIRTLIIDNKKGSIFIETNGLDPNDVFQQNVLTSDKVFNLPVTLTITQKNSPDALFDGQSAIPVFRNGNKLQNK